VSDGPAPSRVAGVGPLGRAVYRLLHTLAVGLARVVWRLEVHGRDRLPTVGPFVLAPIHRSYVDFLVAGISVPRRVRFMAKDSLWSGPRWFVRFIEAMGAYPVNRERPDRDALRMSLEALDAGDPVVMFPEGRRKDGPVVEDLYDGPSWVACRARVPIVPVAIGGSDRAMPIGSRMIRFAKVRVVIGEPILPDVPLTGRVPRRAISEVTEQLGKDLQSLYDEVR